MLEIDTDTKGGSFVLKAREIKDACFWYGSHLDEFEEKGNLEAFILLYEDLQQIKRLIDELTFWDYAHRFKLVPSPLEDKGAPQCP